MPWELDCNSWGGKKHLTSVDYSNTKANTQPKSVYDKHF